MTGEEAKEDIVNILDRQTIKRVRRECERLAAEKDRPTFEAFLEEGTHFILTEKRADILHGVHNGLANQDSPGVILHGAYGSGKTVMMENIAALCQADQELGGHEFSQLHYDETPLDCITVSLEQNDTPTDFLHALFEALVTQSENVGSDDLKAIFNDRKLDELTMEDLDESLPPSQREHLIDLFEDPDSLEDIARVSKSLTSGDAHKPITWFTTFYHDREGRYPALYIDEFEQLFRQGVDPGGTYRLKAIIQKMIRNAVSGFERLDTPPYILFANTLSLDELKDRFSAERDLIDRITESVSYNIDLSEDETKELFAKLYRLYVIPLTADYDGETQDWHETLAATDIGDNGYVYPYTDDALNFALSIVQKFEDETRGETVVRAFRDYKRILIAFLDHWDGGELIDLDFLYIHGDQVREQLRGKVERVNLDELPGEGSIETTIEADYNDAAGIQRRVLHQIAKVGILQREERPVYFTAGEITIIADGIELQIEEREAADLITQAANGPDYFEQEGDRLEFNPNELTGTAIGEDELSLADQVGETVDYLGLEEKNLIQLWESMQEQCFPDTSFDNQNDQYLEFNTDDLNYTSNVYLTLAPDSLPEQLQVEVDDEALHIVIRLGRDPDGDLPARFYVTERNGRAPNITDEIQASLNQEIEAHFDEESDYYDLIEAIQDKFPRFDPYQAYVLFVKLSMAELAGEDIHNDITARTAEQLSFSIITTVGSNVINIADDYPRTKLGFNGAYAGKDYLNLVYGIKHLEQEGELIHTDANLRDIDPRSFSRVSRTRESGDEFRSIVSSFADNESFIQKQDDGEFRLVPQFSSYSPILDKIESQLDEDGLDFDEILELIFGTTEVENVTKAMVYLLLVLGQYWDNYSWVFEDDDETTIIPADVRIETQREQTRQQVGRAIEIEILDQAKQVDPDNDLVEELKKKYDSVDDADATLLDELQDEVDADWEFDYQGVNESLREIGANDVFADTAVATYATTIRSLGSIDAELRYLILDDLGHLVTHVKQAASVLEKQEQVDDLVTKVEWFDIDPDLQSEGLEIDCITTVEEFWESRQVERNIEDADIANDLDGYLEGDIQLNRLINMLQCSRKSIVPQIATYDADDDLDDLNTDFDLVRRELEEAIEEEQDKVDVAQDELEEFRARIPGESSWLRHGDYALDDCKSELESSPEQFDHKQYGEHWLQWKRARGNLVEEAFGEEEFEDTVRKYDSDIDIEVVENATEDGIDSKFTELDDDAFEQVITVLDRNSDAAEELKQSLLKIRVKAELMRSES
jgi:hypothetical protein